MQTGCIDSVIYSKSFHAAFSGTSDWAGDILTDFLKFSSSSGGAQVITTRKAVMNEPQCNCKAIIFHINNWESTEFTSFSRNLWCKLSSFVFSRLCTFSESRTPSVRNTQTGSARKGGIRHKIRSRRRGPTFQPFEFVQNLEFIIQRKLLKHYLGNVGW